MAIVRARAMLLAGALAVALPGPVRAQDLPLAATVVGRVVAADGGEPIRFSLVYLVRADSAIQVRATLTDADGRFYFGGVHAGGYRVRVDRLGYEPEPGPPIVLAPGEHYTAFLASTPRPVQIAPIVVSGEACYGEDELKEVPELAKLWREAAKAAEARRLFELAYRYAVTIRQEVWQVGRFGRGPRETSERTATNTVARAALMGARATAGYGLVQPDRIVLTAPELPELFGPTFLETHCLTPQSDRGRERRIGFRPLSQDSGRVEIRGTIVLDRALAVDRLEFEYLDGARPFAAGVLHFADVPVLGARLRFARVLDVRGLTRSGGLTWAGSARLQRYRDFVRDTAH